MASRFNFRANKFCSVLVALLPGLACMAAPGARIETKTPGPIIQFDGTSCAFGTTIAGNLITHDFVFTNAGDALLRLNGVYPSCTCTIVNDWTREVPPGRTGRISLQFDSTRFSGAVAETTVVLDNDAARHNVILSFSGVVKKPLEVNPPMIILRPLIDGEAGDTCTAKIVNNLPEPVTLGKPVCSDPSLSASVKTTVSEREFQLTVQISPPIRSAMMQGTVTMRTSSERTSSLTVPILVLPQLPLDFSPATVLLPAGPLTIATNVIVTLVNRGRNPLSVAEANVDAVGATVQIQEKQPGREFHFLLSFPAGFQLPTNREASLNIVTTNLGTPVLKVPLRPLPALPPQKSVFMGSATASPQP